MKRLFILLGVLLFTFIFSACDNRDKTKIAMDKSFREFIKENDKKTNYNTRIQHVDIISYIALEDSNRQNENEVYEAKVHFMATTSYEGSMKIYNINDTITSFFDKDLKMTRKINPPQ